MKDQAANLIERWRIDRKREPETTYYNPGASFYLRTRLADLLQADETLRDSQDGALRYSYWRSFDRKQNSNWPSDMKQVFQREDERDAYATLTEALGNDLLWRRPKERDLLRQLSWAAPHSRSLMDIPNSYRACEKARRVSSPDWFDGLPIGIGKDALRVPNEGEPRWASEILSRVVRLEGLRHRSQFKFGRREMNMTMSEAEARENQQDKQTNASTSW